MLMTDTTNIKEVMLFPAMKPDESAPKNQDGGEAEKPGKLNISSPDQYHA